MWSMFVGVTLVCLIWMELCMICVRGLFSPWDGTPHTAWLQWFYPRRCRHWTWSAKQRTDRVWKRRGRRRRETGEGQNEDNNTQTHIMEWKRTKDTMSLGWSWAMQWVCTQSNCKVHEKNDVWGVSVFTPPSVTMGHYRLQAKPTVTKRILINYKFLWAHFQFLLHHDVLE